MKCILVLFKIDALLIAKVVYQHFESYSNGSKHNPRKYTQKYIWLWLYMNKKEEKKKEKKKRKSIDPASVG